MLQRVDLCSVFKGVMGAIAKIVSVVSLCIACSMFVAFAGPSQASAQTKSLKLYYTHTKERAKIVFKKNGRYDKAGLKKLNRFLRDWRTNEPINMDPRLFDILWETYRQAGAKNYIHVVSAYRSPATNAMLRKTRGGQAKKSQHMVGKAIDFYVPGVKTSKLRAIGMKLQGGGVGYYPKSASPFVHLDVGSVRAWPRMSRGELVKLFPNGKTLHLPTDGKPLPGYQVALRDQKKRGAGIAVSSSKTKTPVKKPTPARTIIAKAEPKKNPSSTEKDSSSGGLFGLFGRKKDDAPAVNTVVASAASTAAPSPQVIEAELPTYATNLASLPRNNIPFPNLLDAGQDQITASQEPILVAAQVEDPNAQTTLSAATSNALQQASAVPADLVRPLAEDAPLQVLAYNEPEDSVQLPSFAAIIAAAVETDKKRKRNGEVPTPVVTQNAQASEDVRVDFASLETPVLRAHNRISRAALSDNISKVWEASKTKVGRPNLRDAIQARYKASPSTPTLEQIIISQRVFSQKSIASMKSPAKGPRFVNRFMRKAPKIIYASGFSKENRSQQNQKSFQGNAVNFLPVVKYSG
jgi:uncharacterized protein YcbK (DUF882 family)